MTISALLQPHRRGSVLVYPPWSGVFPSATHIGLLVQFESDVWWGCSLGAGQKVNPVNGLIEAKLPHHLRQQMGPMDVTDILPTPSTRVILQPSMMRPLFVLSGIVSHASPSLPPPPFPLSFE